MMQGSDRPRRPQRVAIVLTVLVGVIATAVAYLGTREGTQAPVSPPAAPAGATLPLETVVLPHDEPDLPPGPYQRTFATSCTICHSTRLVMTQPPFPRKTWEEEVHKMVKTYGAPINPDEEEQIVDYLMTVRGE
jgi:mono/diheme cytochrome c family protein